jgi:hypothetical protein
LNSLATASLPFFPFFFFLLFFSFLLFLFVFLAFSLFSFFPLLLFPLGAVLPALSELVVETELSDSELAELLLLDVEGDLSSAFK